MWTSISQELYRLYLRYSVWTITHPGLVVLGSLFFLAWGILLHDTFSIVVWSLHAALWLFSPIPLPVAERYKEILRKMDEP